MNQTSPVPLCVCGCGNSVKKGRNGRYNDFCLGHNVKHAQSVKPSKNVNSGQFRPGNTKGQGRPVGSRNSVTVAAENLIQGEGEALSRKLIELALAGNVACLKVAIERLVPPVKSKPVHLPDMPKICSIADASKLTAYVLEAVAEGKVSPVEGEIISRSAERHIKSFEIRDLDKRIADLENRLISDRSI